jgi:nicotinamidase-related amidase
MQTHMCVEAAVRAASDDGFEVILPYDTCATRDLSFGGVEVPARQVHTAVLAALSGTYAKVLTTDELLAELR